MTLTPSIKDIQALLRDLWQTENLQSDQWHKNGGNGSSDHKK